MVTVLRIRGIGIAGALAFSTAPTNVGLALNGTAWSGCLALGVITDPSLTFNGTGWAGGLSLGVVDMSGTLEELNIRGLGWCGALARGGMMLDYAPTFFTSIVEPQGQVSQAGSAEGQVTQAGSAQGEVTQGGADA